MRRLQVLVESQLEVCAYNLSSFLIKHVFEDFLEKRPKFVFLHQKWLKANNNRGKENAYNILDIHLALLYKRKEDTSKLHYLVSVYEKNEKSKLFLVYLSLNQSCAMLFQANFFPYFHNLACNLQFKKFFAALLSNSQPLQLQK